MSYSYQTERPWLFTEEGQVQLLKVRDHIEGLLEEAGAFDVHHAVSVVSGDSWKHQAIVDRLVELKEIRLVDEARQVYVGTRR